MSWCKKWITYSPYNVNKGTGFTLAGKHHLTFHFFNLSNRLVTCYAVVIAQNSYMPLYLSSFFIHKSPAVHLISLVFPIVKPFLASHAELSGSSRRCGITLYCGSHCVVYFYIGWYFLFSS